MSCTHFGNVDIARQLTPALQITSHVREVWLVEEVATVGWDHTATFPLGP
jgi:hypothetical protein